MTATRSSSPIRRRKLYEEVVVRIEEMIHEGRFAPGDQLPSEKDLMDELGVGRSTVREALLSLRRMGLVTVRSGERARVTTPTPVALVNELSGAARLLLAQEGGMERFQEARALFEVGLARLAAERATDEDIARLASALDANREAIGDYAAFGRTDVAFHNVIASVPGNPIFTSMQSAVSEWLTEQRTISGRSPYAFTAALSAHTRIFDAIAARDPARAQVEMQLHLDEVAKFYWQALKPTGP
jgi:GntR family transcriptional regulator, sialic acid-inducible nan operon repressor